ncbi:hypothetical protein QYM36_009041 [Artemia franciscana]|uniref:RecQ-mediated genome instability protein 1 n=1 Tax=Artemia franciscana TaxID=6661 RepID=A0AA88HS17_ARTSF|nr:hypothetical protein QYM36_009041 [Artemia franciscana]
MPHEFELIRLKMVLTKTAIDIKGKLIGKNARASDNWIAECVDFFLSELGNINGVQDISQSAFSQLQKIRKHDVENVEFSNQEKKKESNAWEPKSSRVLMFALTDGAQEIRGLEVMKLPMLELNLIPGTKIAIRGPVQCRKGVLFLKEMHVKVIGGEVDSLIIPNAAENILARKLNQPENPSPYADDVLLVNETPSDVQSMQRDPNVQTPPGSRILSLTDTETPAANVSIQRQNGGNKIKSIVAQSAIAKDDNQLDIEDDLDLARVDVDSIVQEAERQHFTSHQITSHTSSSSLPPTLKSKTSSKPNLASLKEQMSKGNLAKRSAEFNSFQVEISDTLVESSSQIGSEEVSSSVLDSIFTRIDYKWSSENFNAVPQIDFQTALKSREDSFHSASSAIYVDASKKCAWFVVQSYFTTIVSKLEVTTQIRPLEWTLSAKVCDGSTSITANLSNKILKYLMKFDADEVRLRLKNGRDRFYPELQKIKEESGQRLSQINSLMIFAWPFDEARPIIMEISELTREWEKR